MAAVKLSAVVAVLVLTLWLITSAQYVEQMFQESSETFPKTKSPETSPKTKSVPFSFASYYSDHMVLQRAPKRAQIWGYSSRIGERIIIKLSSRGIYTTKVYLHPFYNFGVWKIMLPAESSSGPFTITAISSEKTIHLNDVLFGDVWICSGQSNMQFSMIQVYNATEEIATAHKYPDIRLFAVSEVPSAFPIPDLHGILEPWTLPSNKTLGGRPFTYFSAVCWLFGKNLYKKLGYPIGLIDTTWGGTPVEAWSSHDALAKCGLEKDAYTAEDQEWLKQNGQVLEKNGVKVGPSSPSNLWNGMVFPFLNMTIYGAIWYQGEANTITNVHKYNCTFPAMIDDWREKFHAGTQQTDPMFPFGFVQLAANKPDSPAPGFSEIRWHQTADFGYVPNPRMKNVFMAVAMDLPDFGSPYGSVHPRDKQDVANRLTLSGLSVAYNQPDLTFQGPRPTSLTEGPDSITLMYSSKIALKNLLGFEVLCAVKDSNVQYWMGTPVLHWESDKILLFSLVCGGERVLGLRYSWSESPCSFKTCTVYSADNPLVPGPPFILYQGMTGNVGTVHKLDWSAPVHIRELGKPIKWSEVVNNLKHV